MKLIEKYVRLKLGTIYNVQYDANTVIRFNFIGYRYRVAYLEFGNGNFLVERCEDGMLISDELAYKIREALQ